ncbi:MAG: hypothetical protein WBM13_10070 [Bacteroidia bacterium]
MSANNFKYYSIFFTLFLLPYFTQAQIVSSPYSRYGIGDMGGKGFGQNLAMAGTSIAMQNDTTAMFFINSNNPASYANYRLTAAEVGTNVSLTQLQSSSTKQSVNNASLSYISLAIPLKKWWGASVGLMPYSSVGYKVSDQQTITGAGDVNFVYEGSGGINQVYFGNGIKPFYTLKKAKALKHLSLGANASYLFGSSNNVKRSVFDGTYFFNTRSGTTTRVADIYLDYGLQYAYSIDSINGRELKDKVKLLFGATFANETPINATIDSLTYNYYLSSQNIEYGKDTVQNVQNVKGEIIFPKSIGVGIGFKKGDKLIVAADYRMQYWSTYKAFDKSQKLKNGSSISVGAQYTPNSKANGKGSYAKRINYRAGFRYVQTPLELKNTALNEYSLTAGLGFPVGRSFLLQNFSMINIGLELGQRGTTDNGLIKQQFIKCTIGVTINDRWFVKPKFD